MPATNPPPEYLGVPMSSYLSTRQQTPWNYLDYNSTGSTGVQFIREDVRCRLDEWRLTEACIMGERAVKSLRELVLPRPNVEDTSADNLSRYETYLTRAVFYGVTERTLTGLVGYAFSKDPIATIPATLDPLRTNVDGSGMSLIQQTKSTLGFVLAYGQCGLLVDYPEVGEKVTTQQDVLDGKISPTIVLYHPNQITNWQIVYEGARATLQMLVLRECYTTVLDDGFTIRNDVQFRVLRLKDNAVTGEIHRRSSPDGSVTTPSGDFMLFKSFAPKDKNGQPLTEIPFTFVGVESNEGKLSPSPLSAVATLNIAHFRNSADYEEACFIVGQPTVWVSGLTESWVRDVLKGKISFGSRGGIPLPVGAQAGLLQVQPNTLPYEAMKAKEAQMVALGAKLLETTTIQRTAYEVSLETAADVSVLTAAAANVFAAYRKALKLCSLYIGSEIADIQYDLAEPLHRDTLPGDVALAILQIWQGGLISFEEARLTYRKAGLASQTDAEALAAISTQPPPTLDPALQAKLNPPPPKSNKPTPAPKNGPTGP